MTKHRSPTHVAVIVVFCVLLIGVNLPEAVGRDDQSPISNPPEEEEASDSKSRIIIDAAKALFSRPTYSVYWPSKLKDLFQLGRSTYFNFGGPTPNLETDSSSREEDMGGREEEGTAEKMKEAVVKSLDKSKSTVEDSAKSAAKFAEKAMDKTFQKMKRTLSGKANMEAHHEQEL